MDRRHPEHPSSGKAERCDLDHHRQRLDDEYAAHDEQHDFLPHDHRDRAKCGAQRQRTDIAHKHFGWIRVKPKETQPGSRHRAADHRELARSGNVRKLQVAREDCVAADVSKNAERRTDHHGRHDRETVETVRQIDCVAGPHDHTVGERDEAPDTQWVRDRLDERNDQIGLGWQSEVEAATDPREEHLDEARVVRRRYRECEIDRGDESDR